MEQPKSLVVLGLVLIGLISALMLYPVLPDKVQGLVSGTGTVAFSIHDKRTIEYTDWVGMKTRIIIHRFTLFVDKVVLVDANGTEYVVWSRTELDLTRENVNKTHIPHCTWITRVIIILTRIEFNATVLKDLNGNGEFDEPPAVLSFCCNASVWPPSLTLFGREWLEWAYEHHPDAMRKWEGLFCSDYRCILTRRWYATWKLPEIPPKGLRIEIDVHFHVSRGDYILCDWDLGIPKPEGWELPTSITITRS